MFVVVDFFFLCFFLPFLRTVVAVRQSKNPIVTHFRPDLSQNNDFVPASEEQVSSTLADRKQESQHQEISLNFSFACG